MFGGAPRQDALRVCAVFVPYRFSDLRYARCTRTYRTLLQDKLHAPPVRPDLKGRSPLPLCNLCVLCVSVVNEALRGKNDGLEQCTCVWKKRDPAAHPAEAG